MVASTGGIEERDPLIVREHEQLTGLSQEEYADLRNFALENQADQEGNYRPVLAARNGKLHARNYVGVIETRRGTVLEILPKVDFAGGDEGHERTRQIFLKMLRTYHGLRSAQFNQTSISELRRFNMLEAFVRLFLNNLVLLTQRGLAHHYSGVEDNLPRLRGRILFPQHIRRNAANRARFYVGFDEFMVNRPVNRLIQSALRKLRSATHPANQQLLHQLRICFSEVPQSTRPEVDWQRHRIDRSMRHYDAVMAWVGLFLFNHGLATFAGKHVNQALLFPMEEVFEDFLVDAFKRHQCAYGVRTRGPQQPFAQIHDRDAFQMKPEALSLAEKEDNNGINGRDAFQMKPDIALMKAGKAQFILDAKWKKIDGGGQDPKHGVSQGDIYQLYAYGRKFGCPRVALIYPRTQRFRSPLSYKFIDEVAGQPLRLLCLPFNVEQPQSSVENILQQLTD